MRGKKPSETIVAGAIEFRTADGNAHRAKLSAAQTIAAMKALQSIERKQPKKPRENRLGTAEVLAVQRLRLQGVSIAGVAIRLDVSEQLVTGAIERAKGAHSATVEVRKGPKREIC